MRGRVGVLALLLASSLASSAQTFEAKTIRVWGYDGMRPVMLRWEAAFERTHPGVHFTNTFHGAAAAPAGLYDGVADIAVLGREWWPVDNMAFHWVFQYAPFGAEVVASSPTAPRPSFTPVVIVNAANPLQQISVAQLDAVFGSQHLAVPTNARVWRDLGVAGELSEKLIEPVGFGPDDSLGVFFRKRVLHNDYKPNPASVLLQGPAADEELARRVARDRNAMGYTSGEAAARERGVRTIAVVDAQGNAVQPSDPSISSGAYPLSRTLSLYLNRKPGERLPKELEEFLEFVVSDDGQKLVAGEGFLPLSDKARHTHAARITGEWTTEARNAEWKE